MNKLSLQEHKKLINILKENERYLTAPIEEKAADIIESIVLEAKVKKKKISKAKINLINTPLGPEVGVTFEE